MPLRSRNRANGSPIATLKSRVASISRSILHDTTSELKLNSASLLATQNPKSEYDNFPIKAKLHSEPKETTARTDVSCAANSFRWLIASSPVICIVRKQKISQTRGIATKVFALNAFLLNSYQYEE